MDIKSETPRTDEAQEMFQDEYGGGHYVVEANFARSIERELSATSQHCSNIEQENRQLKDRLRQQKKYLVAANRGAERNSVVSQMLAARLALRNK